MKSVHILAFILLIVGGLNWLLTAFGYGIGNYIPEMAAKTIYILVGLSAIFELIGHKKCCKVCSAGAMPPATGGM